MQEAEPALYLYHLDADGHGQTGVAACYSLAEYDSDVIKKHERTRKDKEDDRTRHIVELRAQTGPVFLAHRPDARIDDLARRVRTNGEPLVDFTALDGVRHAIWRVERGPGAGSSSRRSTPSMRSTSPTGIIAPRAPRARAKPFAIQTKRISFSPWRFRRISCDSSVQPRCPRSERDDAGALSR